MLGELPCIYNIGTYDLNNIKLLDDDCFIILS